MTSPAPPAVPPASTPPLTAVARAFEVFHVFLRLGLTSFGGPVAHLGFFRAELVARRRWIDEAGYADLIALSQFLPGPASSQTALALAAHRAGWAGALLGWLAFTLPSAALMVLVAEGIGVSGAAGAGWIWGLKAVAVAVVADAVRGMGRTLAPDRVRALVAAVAAAFVLLVPGTVTPVWAIAGGLLAGFLFLSNAAVPASEGAGLSLPWGRRTGLLLLALAVLLLILLPVLARTEGGAFALFEAFYRAGALVFGGGHVVLPLIEAQVVGPGWIGADAFLAGYGAAQAVPGPLFTFAAYVGTLATVGPGGIAGAVIALVAVFLPGSLLVLGTLPFWNDLRRSCTVRRALAGANAAVVGVLAAALYDPIFITAVHSATAAAFVVLLFALLVFVRVPVWLLALIAAAGGEALSLTGVL